MGKGDGNWEMGNGKCETGDVKRENKKQEILERILELCELVFEGFPKRVVDLHKVLNKELITTLFPEF